eukprot:gene4509-4945_t
MKDHVRILLLGDDGVGKSSLISTYISRHFPQNIPSILADATIPAESNADDVPVTILDSSSRLSERDQLKKKITLADSLVILYDVTRPETLESVSQSWLPLIIDVCGGSVKKPVLVLGTKIDRQDDDEDLEKLQAIIERFPFVVLATKCSAVKLEVDRVFHLGASLVTHPLFPIFDMNSKDLTPSSRSAFFRIFRITDLDGDNLWSDDELFRIQSQCFMTPITAREVPAIKRQIQISTPGGISNNRLTFEGFLALMKMSIFSAMGVVPWTILRKYGYDDDLNLQIPKEITIPPPLRDDEVAELTDDAKAFLLSLARNAYTENEKPINPDSDSNSEIEDCLTWEALRFIWSTLTTEDNMPWAHPPNYNMSWAASEDKVHPTTLSILLTGLPHSGANFSFDAWLCQWSSLAVIDPVRTQILLFKLGYVDRPDLGLVGSKGTVRTLQEEYDRLKTPKSSWPSLFYSPFSSSSNNNPFRKRTTANICVLGDNGVGKSSLVYHLSDLTPPGARDILGVEKGQSGQKAFESIVVGSCMVDIGHLNENPASVASGPHSSMAVVQPSHGVASKDSCKNISDKPPSVGHLKNPLCTVFTAIPKEHIQQWMKTSIHSCDCVVIVFQCGDLSSLQYAWKVNEMLPDHIPRLFVAQKVDLLQGASRYKNSDLLRKHEEVLEAAVLYASEHDLPKVHCISTMNASGMKEFMITVEDVLLHPLKGLPKRYKIAREAAAFNTRVLIYLSTAVSIVSLSTLLWRYNKEVKSWLHQLWRVPTVLRLGK